jgi:hypothetical protein
VVVVRGFKVEDEEVKMMGPLHDERKKATDTILSRDEEHCKRHFIF